MTIRNAEGMAMSLKRAGFVTEQARSGEEPLRMTRPGALALW